eukprot:TRINITY_DN5645_c1_g1_i1.p1 TRINITY_DN5645_c1_g1~~TRINITY_DN5645_c1_g1_i1.p1  ORF type:complete len:186 (+),score=27.53 TRINITY_DN5645_c1_g1_i1:37-558(+)
MAQNFTPAAGSPAAAQPEPISNLDSLCLIGGTGAWFIGRSQLGEAGGLPIAPGRWHIPVRILGGLLLAASINVRMQAIESFKKNDTPLAHRLEVKKMVTDGPFEYSRNPMYLGMVGAIGSMGLLLNSWWGVGSALPFAAYLHLQVIPQEEEYMRRNFNHFDEYAKKTPRWLLF